MMVELTVLLRRLSMPIGSPSEMSIGFVYM